MENHAQAGRRLHKGILWDLDGTLVDTTRFHWLAWFHETSERSKPITWNDFASTFGQRNDMIIPVWFPNSNSPELIAEIGESKEVRFRKMVLEEGLSLLPGTLHWLQEFQKMGFPQALATMAPRLNIDAIFSVLPVQPFFSSVVTADDVSKGKPDPEVFLKAAMQIGIPTQDCVVIEDSHSGIEAARRAGIQTIGVKRDEVLQADIFVSSLEELKEKQVYDLLNDEKR
jgi:HAD superfamily hydrolase (TIGR01509 family)